ncbi:MAG: TlpA disulfide reductase family protein, partial [Bacteroidales bacterium]
LSDNDNSFFTANKAMVEEDVYAKNFTPIMNLIKAGEQLQKTAEGQQFTDFTVKGGSLTGEDISLSNFVGKGKYILVDFWASWCGPCRAEIPNILNIYKKYKGDKFDVLSVAVWDEKAETLKAIEEEKLPWNQIINGQEEPASLYGINGIPHIILFAPDGTIVKRGLRDVAMEEAVKEALGK